MALVGAAPKNYLVYGDPLDPNAVGFIAKKPTRSGYLEAVTEEMISSIGRLLPSLRIARSRVVRLTPAIVGPSVDVRFLSRNFLRRGEDVLLHAVELMAAFLDSTTAEVSTVFGLGNPTIEGQHYTVETAVQILKWWGRSDDERRNLCRDFGHMLAFDALIGAHDRHAMNWGVVDHPKSPSAARQIAPLFDSARGLFWDHREEKLEKIESSGDRDQYVETYANRSRPLFGCGQPEGQRVTHFELLEHVEERMASDLAEPIRRIVRQFDLNRIESMLTHKFRRMVTPRRLRFVTGLLRYRWSRARDIVLESRT